MKKIILGLFFIAITTQFGLTTQTYAQVISDGMLPEIEVYALNYKYLSSIDNAAAPVPVKLLERKVANFDVTELELYRDDYDFYSVSFYIPEGNVVAAYDKQGELLRTIEKYKNITVPKPVAKSVAKRFPGWIIYRDVYKVSFYENSGLTKQEYKLMLENGDKRMKVKIDPKGNFL